MIQGKKITVVLPAYNAERTLEKTWMALERNVADDLILVDDCSQDRTVEIALRLGIHVIRHERNSGYGANQKSCYQAALKRGADIVVMVHPDYQYAPELVPAMAWLIACGLFDVVLGSRILGTGALKGGCLYINTAPIGSSPLSKTFFLTISYLNTTPAIAPFPEQF